MKAPEGTGQRQDLIHTSLCCTPSMVILMGSMIPIRTSYNPFIIIVIIIINLKCDICSNCQWLLDKTTVSAELSSIVGNLIYAMVISRN